MPTNVSFVKTTKEKVSNNTLPITNGQVIFTTDSKEIFLDNNNTRLKMNSYNEEIKVLKSGSTSLVITNSNITTDSTIDVYTNVYGVNPTDIKVEKGTITLTFDSQTLDVTVKVRIS